MLPSLKKFVLGSLPPKSNTLSCQNEDLPEYFRRFFFFFFSWNIWLIPIDVFLLYYIWENIKKEWRGNDSVVGNQWRVLLLRECWAQAILLCFLLKMELSRPNTSLEFTQVTRLGGTQASWLNNQTGNSRAISSHSCIQIVWSGSGPTTPFCFCFPRCETVPGVPTCLIELLERLLTREISSVLPAESIIRTLSKKTRVVFKISWWECAVIETLTFCVYTPARMIMLAHSLCERNNSQPRACLESSSKAGCLGYFWSWRSQLQSIWPSKRYIKFMYELVEMELILPEILPNCVICSVNTPGMWF